MAADKPHRFGNLAIVIVCGAVLVTWLADPQDAVAKGSGQVPGFAYKPLGELDALTFTAVFLGDPFQFDEELRTYDTKLKRKVFLKSEEGKRKLRALKKKRETILQNSYQAALGRADDYDTKSGGFPITISNEPLSYPERAWILEMGQYLGAPSIGGLWLPNQLKVQVTEGAYGIYRHSYRRVFVRVAEDKALKVEQAGHGVTTKLHFHLTGKVHGWKNTSNLPEGYYVQKWGLEISDLTVQFYDDQGNLLLEQQL